MTIFLAIMFCLALSAVSGSQMGNTDHIVTELIAVVKIIDDRLGSLERHVEKMHADFDKIKGN